MNQPRFYCEHLSVGELELGAEDAQHASNVLRLQAGSAVELFDGIGRSAAGVLSEVRKRCVRVDVQAINEGCDQVKDLELLVALPKGDRQKVLVDGLTQLGVRKLTPLICERTVAQPKENALVRLRKSVIESCKQCRRNTLMEIGKPVAVQDIESWDQPSRTRCVAHPYSVHAGGQEVTRAWDIHDEGLRSEVPVSVAVGPEGGFTDEEVIQLFRSNWDSVSLGNRILRVEMAALKIAAVLGT
ncbi:MAG: RsmE family RNA methyltransferase [Planctomycetota bacterium]